MGGARLAKAVSLKVVACKDGSYQVAGTTGTYTLQIVDGAMVCHCLGYKSNRPCSHAIAAHHYHQERNKQINNGQ